MRKKNVEILLIVLILVLLIIYWQFFFDMEKRKVDELLGTYLNEEYHPENLEVKHRLAVTGEESGIETLYGSMWDKDDIHFWTGLHYNDRDRNIKRFSIHVENIKDIEINEQNTDILVGKYFKNITKKFKCEEMVEGPILCESFWTDDNQNKIGVGALGTSKRSFLFFCVFPLGSENYGWRSCVETKK